MRFFRKPYSVCAECKVHFEPAPTSRHAELCPQHRKPVVEREDRIAIVVDWAKQHWESLEPQALQASQAAMQNMYNASMQSPIKSGIGSLYSLMGNDKPFGL